MAKYDESEGAAEIAAKIDAKEKETEVSDTRERQDEDFKMWKLDPSAHTGSLSSGFAKEQSWVHDNDVNVVFEEPRAHADEVQSILNSSEMQIAVRMAEAEGEDKREDIGKLERLLTFAFEQADMRLRRLLFPPFREATVWFSTIRGWAIGRTLVYKRKPGDVIFDLLPMDSRWFSYEMGGDGFLWTGYKTFRSGASVKDEWGYKSGKKTDNEMIDYWRHDGDRKFVNAVICNKEFLKKPTIYELRSHPVTAVPVATRPPISIGLNSKDEDSGGYGDSIFAPMRAINRTRNQFASIIATHANILSKQPLINYKDESGITLDKSVYFAEAIRNLPMDHNRLEAAPMNQLSPVVVEIMRMLNDQISRVTLPHVSIGSPPPSGTLYNLVQEAGNKVLNPQIKNLSYFYVETCRRIEEQLIDGSISVPVGVVDKKKYFEVKVTPVDLKKSHITKVEFTAKTPWTQLDTAQVAQMLEGLGLPKTWIWENILKIDDVQLIRRLLALEAYEYSPEGIMKKAVEVLADMGYGFEAAKLVEKMDLMEEQERQGVMGRQGTPTPAQLPPSTGAR